MTSEPADGLPSQSQRLSQQLSFIVEADDVKHVFRQTVLLNGSRRENDAEHMWHLSLMAVVLSEQADPEVDLLRVLQMLLIHDLVEIDAGDTFRYDTAGYTDKFEREARAAERIFGLLPPDQGTHFHRLWHEFEARETPEARFGAALDRLQPLLHNFLTHGRTWQEHGVTAGEVLAGNRHIADGAPQLWTFARQLIDLSVERGYLAP